MKVNAREKYGAGPVLHTKQEAAVIFARIIILAALVSVIFFVFSNIAWHE